MAQIRIRHLVHRVRRARRLYYWQPGPRLRGEGWAPRPLGDDLAAAMAAAEAINREVDLARRAGANPVQKRTVSAPRPPARTLGALIDDYLKSNSFTRLRPSSKRGYQQCLEVIRHWAGDAPAAVIDFARIEHLRLAMQSTPAYANAVVRVLRIVLGRGVKLEWIARNPAEKPGLHGAEPSGLIWPRAAVAAFVAAADDAGRHSIGTAVMLDEWIGQRQGDLRRLPRSIWRAGNLTLRQSKTGAGVSLPVGLVPQLAHRIEAAIAMIDARNHPVRPAQLIVDKSTGLAYGADRFRHVFAEIRAAAARVTPAFEVDYLLPGRRADDPHAFTVRMTDLRFMHLRHTAVTRLAEASCETPLIAAVTGHSPKSVDQILSIYLIRTRAQAALAFQKRLAAEGDGYARDKEQQL